MLIYWVASPGVVADQRVVLMLASPGGPVEPVGEGEGGAGDELGEEVADLVDCQRDQLGCLLWTVCSFARGEDGVGEHREGGVVVPGVPGTDLVLVEADLALGCLGWVGRTARYPWCGSFSVRPPAEPDVRVSRISRTLDIRETVTYGSVGGGG